MRTIREGRFVTALSLAVLAACARSNEEGANDGAKGKPIDAGAVAPNDAGTTDVASPIPVDAGSNDADVPASALAFTDDAKLIAVGTYGVYFTSVNEPSSVRFIGSDGAIYTATDLPGTAAAIAIDPRTVYAAVNAQHGESPAAIVAIELVTGRSSTFASLDNVTGIALDSDTVYWSALGASDASSQSGAIYRAAKIGGAATIVAAMTDDAPGPFGIVAGDRLSWATAGVQLDPGVPTYAGTFVFDAPRETLDGKGTLVASPTAGSAVFGFARAGSTTVILVAHSGIDVIAMADGAPPRTLSTFAAASSARTPASIISDGTRVYWSEPGEHGTIRAWSPGDTTVTTIASDQKYPNAVTVYESSVYWTAATGIWSHPK